VSAILLVVVYPLASPAKAVPLAIVARNTATVVQQVPTVARAARVDTAHVVPKYHPLCPRFPQTGGVVVLGAQPARALSLVIAAGT
jgi:hypothetical protein